MNQDPRRTQALEALLATTPNTHNAFTYLVPAMADASRLAGRRSLFGRDKGADAHAKFLQALEKSVRAMHMDRVISADTSEQVVLSELLDALKLFAMAYPNWMDAYRFGDKFFGQGIHPELSAVIASANTAASYFSRPMITRSQRE